MATTAERPWQAEIVDQLGDAILEQDAPDATHAAVWLPVDGNQSAQLLGRADGELAAVAVAQDAASTRNEMDGDAIVVPLDDLYRWHRAHTAGDTIPEVEAIEITPRRQNVEETPDEEIEVDVDEEHDEHDEQETTSATTSVGPGEQAQVFDASDYDREDLQLDKVDGESITKIAVEFSGRVLLDRSDPADVAMYRRMKLGADIELRVSARVAGTGTGYTTNREGDLDVVVGSKKLKVDTVWVLAPENLG